MTARQITRFLTAASVAALILIPASALAQGPTFGAKVGLNVSNVSIDPSTQDGLTLSPNSKNGVIVGGFAGKDFTKKAGLVVEFLWAQAGSDVKFSGGGFTGDQDIRVDYFSIPVLGRVNLPAGTMTAHVFFGPTFAFKTGDSQSITVNGVAQPITSDNEVKLKGHDTGLTLGAQFDIKKFLIDVRYTWGLVNINDEPNDPTKVKTKQFAVMFGIDFAKK